MRIKALSLIGVATLFLAAGLTGAFRYADAFWLYRGFAPPTVSQVASEIGSRITRVASVPKSTVEKIYVTSSAIHRRQPVWIVLPGGYFGHTNERYPAIYFLHGFPGSPISYLTVARVDIFEDLLVAEYRMSPMIEVLPLGSTSLFRDNEWADGVNPGNEWETFLARDVVNAVDASFRTIRSGSGRAIAGLSEGAYGALNIALHHPGEFGVVESWSGYVWADPITRIFDHDPRLLAFNSPMDSVRMVASALRKDHVYIWFYIGKSDRLLRQNEEFDRELRRLRIDHSFFAVVGAHSWRLWRRFVPQALMVAARHLSQP